MSRRRRHLAVVFAAALAAGGAAAFAQTGAVTAAPGAAWAPNPAVLKRLAPEETVAGRFRIRPPVGYVRSAVGGPDGSLGFAWSPAPRRDGTRPFLMVTVVAPPPGQQDQYTPAQVLDRFLASVKARRRAWSVRPTESGGVGGVPFVRAFWAGTDVATGRKMRGFHYVGRYTEGGRPRFVDIASQDVEPRQAQTLALTGAAALTFRPVLAPAAAPPARPGPYGVLGGVGTSGVAR